MINFLMQLFDVNHSLDRGTVKIYGKEKLDNLL